MAERWVDRLAVPVGLPATPHDAAIIEASWTEPQEFGVIFDRHFSVIYRFACLRLGASHAEEVAAEVFTVAFRTRARYDVALRDARPWLFGIAANVIRRHRREELRRYRAYRRPPVEASDVEPSERVSEQVTAGALRAKLAVALAALAVGDREVVLLAAAQLSYDEVAQALGIPPGTVGSRLNRARRQLRTSLGGIDPTDVSQEGDHDR